MKTTGKNARYFELRQRFKTSSEIAEVINRSENYVKQRMTCGVKDFTDREKKLLGIGGKDETL